MGLPYDGHFHMNSLTATQGVGVLPVGDDHLANAQ